MDHEKLRQLLSDLGTAIRSKVVSAREGLSAENLAAVTGQAGGDTIFAIDRFGEDALSVVVPAEFEVPVAQVVQGGAETLAIAQPSANLHLPLQCLDRTVGMTHDAEQTPMAVEYICQHLVGEIGVEVFGR